MILLASSLIACKGKDDKAAGSTPSPTAPSDPGPAPDKAPTAPVQAAVDVCSFASRDLVEGVVGKLSEDPKPTPPQGSLLGGCDYSFEGGMLSISARPASEYDATVKAYAGADVAGVGEKAHASEKAGLFVQPAGKQYFLHILGGGAGIDDAKKLEVAKAVTSGAK